MKKTKLIVGMGLMGLIGLMGLMKGQSTNAPSITGIVAAPLPPTTHTFTIPAAQTSAFFALQINQIGSLDPQAASIPATQTLHAGAILILANGNIRVSVTYQ
jgi:hypothetical protein